MKRLLILSVAVSAILVSSCGQICVGGVAGNCKTPDNNQIGNQLQLTPQIAGVYSPTIHIGQVMTLNPQGGTKPYYKRSVDPNGCADVNDVTFTLVPLVPGPCKITVVDSSPQTQYAYVDITILPRLR